MTRSLIDVVSSAIVDVQSKLSKNAPENVDALMRRRRKAETLLSILPNTPVAMLIANDRARYVEANTAATRLTGYTRAELLRMSVWDLTPESNREQGLTQWQAFLQHAEQRGTYRIRRKDGTVIAATYAAVSHVLPSLHLSALATRALLSGTMPPEQPVPDKARLRRDAHARRRST